MAEIFKEKEEMEEFLHNLGTEYRYACYREHNPEGCHLLGDFLHLVRDDYPMAFSVLDYTCRQHKYFKSCNTAGVFTLEGRGTKKDEKKALRYFETACDNGSADGCFHYGQMLSGRDPAIVQAGIRPNPNKSITALEKGCNLDQPVSCYEAGAMHLAGEEVGLPANPEKAFKFMEMACNHFAPQFEACNNLMLMHKRGIGTMRDPVAAAKVQEKLDDYLNLVNKKSTIEMQQGT